MCLPLCSEADPVGIGAQSKDREVVSFDTTDWHWFGRASDFSKRKLRT